MGGFFSARTNARRHLSSRAVRPRVWGKGYGRAQRVPTGDGRAGLPPGRGLFRSTRDGGFGAGGGVGRGGEENDASNWLQGGSGSRENPNGIPASSPGLRGTSYPGNAIQHSRQPQRGCGGLGSYDGRNPVGVVTRTARQLRVARGAQPWAGGRNSVGIRAGGQTRSSQSVPTPPANVRLRKGTAGVSPAGSRGVSPRVATGGETPPELAGEDACGTPAAARGARLCPARRGISRSGRGASDGPESSTAPAQSAVLRLVAATQPRSACSRRRLRGKKYGP